MNYYRRNPVLEGRGPFDDDFEIVVANPEGGASENTEDFVVVQAIREGTVLVYDQRIISFNYKMNHKYGFKISPKTVYCINVL